MPSTVEPHYLTFLGIGISIVTYALREANVSISCWFLVPLGAAGVGLIIYGLFPYWFWILLPVGVTSYILLWNRQAIQNKMPGWHNLLTRHRAGSPNPKLSVTASNQRQCRPQELGLPSLTGQPNSTILVLDVTLVANRRMPLDWIALEIDSNQAGCVGITGSDWRRRHRLTQLPEDIKRRTELTAAFEVPQKMAQGNQSVRVRVRAGGDEWYSDRFDVRFPTI